MGNQDERSTGRILQDIGKSLVEVGEKLEEEQEEAATDLIDSLDNFNDKAEESKEAELRFISYFLTTFTQDLWNNIAMTSSQIISDNDIADILEMVGGHLRKIGYGIKQGDYGKCYDECAELLHEYEKKVNSVMPIDEEEE